MKRSIQFSGLQLLLCLFCMTAVAQQPTLEWDRLYDGGPVNSSTDDYLVAVAVDAAGNSYVTGNSYNPSQEMGPEKINTVKFAPSGEQLWAVQLGDDATATAIAIDKAGGVYVTGYSYDYSYIVTVRYNAATGEESWVQRYENEGSYYNNVAIATDDAGGVYISGAGETVRYNAATGEQTWVQFFDDPDSRRATTKAIAADNAGGVYVTGAGYSSITSSSDYITVRYDAATGQQTWRRQYNGPASRDDEAIAIALDNTGGVYVTGNSSSSNGYDYATVRYDAITGEESWARQYNGPDSREDKATAIAVDNAGGVYVTGTSLSGTTSYDYATVRYDASTGKQSWARRYDGPGSTASDFASALTADNTGGVFVTGRSYGSTGLDYATIRYEAATGKESWAQRYSSGRGATAIAVDNAGGLYVTGSRNSGGCTDSVLTLPSSVMRPPAVN